MRLQVISSGSRGNATLVRVDEFALLVDAGLAAADLEARLESARLGLFAPHAIAVTHGHLDHSRSAGILARRRQIPVYCSAAIQTHPAIRRGKRVVTLGGHRPVEIRAADNLGGLDLLAVELPHDAPPTYAFRMDAGGRRAVVLTDMGRPSKDVAASLMGAHVLVLEFNHDAQMLEAGRYPLSLKRRIRGGLGHLSNDQSVEMLRLLAGPELHTLVLAHLSEHNNRPDIAEEAARAELARLGLGHVRVLVASQNQVGEELTV